MTSVPVMTAYAVRRLAAITRPALVSGYAMDEHSAIPAATALSAAMFEELARRDGVDDADVTAAAARLVGAIGQLAAAELLILARSAPLPEPDRDAHISPVRLLAGLVSLERARRLKQRHGEPDLDIETKAWLFAVEREVLG